MMRYNQTAPLVGSLPAGRDLEFKGYYFGKREFQHFLKRIFNSKGRLCIKPR